MALLDGDTFDAATLQAQLDSVKAEANAVQPGHLRRFALRHEHLPSIVPSDLFSNGLTAWRTAEGAATQTYGNGQAGAWSTSTVDLQVMSTWGTNAPYGPVAVGIPAEDGWRIPAIANVVADAAEVTFTAFSMTTERIKGIFVRGSVQLLEAFALTTPTYDGYDCVLVAIGFTDGAGTRHILEDSILPWSKWAWSIGHCGSGWFIQQSDLDALGDGEIQSFFLATCSRVVVEDVATPRVYDLGNYTVSGVALHAGDLD
jgi:hypothetical protein